MNLIDSFNAFLSNPLKFIADPTNTTIEYQTRKAVTSGMSKKEVEEVLQSKGFTKGSVVLEIFDSVAGGVQFIIKNLPLILILAFGIIMLSYLVPIFGKK